MQQTAHDFGHLYPVAQPLITHSFYVDDLLTGADNPKMPIRFTFNLRKWRSSSTTLISQIDPTLRESIPVQDHTNGQDSHSKALDTMSTSLCLPAKYAATKHGIISDVARTFDVLGWLAPIIVLMKLLYQQLWEGKLGWDEALPPEYVQQHAKWRSELHVLSSCQQPRCYFAKNAHRLTTHLHGFCDASHAYAAVVYVRATYADHPQLAHLLLPKLG